MAKQLSSVGGARRHDSVEGALAGTSDATRSAQERVAAALADLKRARDAAQAAGDRAKRAAERVSAIRASVPSTPTVAPAPVSKDATGPDRLDALRARLAESEAYTEELHRQAIRFPLLRRVVDGFRFVVPRRSQRAAQPQSVRRAIDRAAEENLGDLEALTGHFENLRLALDERDRYAGRLASTVAQAKAALAHAVDADAAAAGRAAAELCTSAETELRRAATDILLGEEVAVSLAERAGRYRDDIRLVGSIMSAESDVDAGIAEAFREFVGLLSEYLNESRQDNYPAEADAYADLMLVRSKIARVRFAPRLAGKNIVAVAGGFSSGKSSFVNSLIGPESRLLPTKITPTTSIPTYVHGVPDAPLEIASFNNAGGKHTLDEEALRSITHEFETQYGVALKQLVDRIVVSTPDLGWDRIAFVDTPGYTNPEGEGEQRRDEELALDEVLSAHYLVWVVDCERGTLPATDVDYIRRFLDKHGRSAEKEVYILVSKADKKPSADLPEILDRLVETTAKADIPCAGIGMYSALRGEWFDTAGEAFNTFLDEINARQPDLGFKSDVQDVLGRYVDFHRNGAKQCASRVGLMRRLQLVADGEGKRSSLVEDLRSASETLGDEAARHDSHAERYASLRRRFGECVDALVMRLGDRHVP